MLHPEITTTKDLKDALSWLNEYAEKGSVILAGGTDLFVGWRSGIPKPKDILNIGELVELKGIERDNGYVRIGALTTMAEISSSRLMNEIAPSLAHAADSMGSPAIRERATIGGNLCHASPAADTAAPLLALNAVVELQSANKSRKIPLHDFFTGPGETIKENNELLICILVPIENNRREFYMRLAQRRAMACVKISVAGAAISNQSKLHQVRIALGAVAPIPMLAHKTMSVLESADIDNTIIEQAAQTAMKECNPIVDIRSTIEYRRDMVGELLKQGIDLLLNRNNAK